MAGRAGRAGIDDFGEAILMLQDNTIELGTKLINASLEPCTSALLDAR
jgi:replicative superfamily II helicase